MICISALHLIIVMQIGIITAIASNDTSSVGFLCKSGGILNVNQICDGRSDCYDGSDEIKELCYRTICPDGQFRCHYGACISRSKKCNGVRDCSDGKFHVSNFNAKKVVIQIVVIVQVPMSFNVAGGCIVAGKFNEN